MDNFVRQAMKASEQAGLNTEDNRCSFLAGAIWARSHLDIHKMDTQRQALVDIRKMTIVKQRGRELEALVLIHSIADHALENND
jgi:hypothetical protein